MSGTVLSVVILVVSSVTMCPWVAADQRQEMEQGSKYTGELTAMLKQGPVDLQTVSGLSLFRDAGVKGIDIVVDTDGDEHPALVRGEPGAKLDQQQVRTERGGIFTVMERPRGGYIGARAASAGVDAAYETGLVANLSQAGYDLRGKTTQGYETTIRFKKLPNIDPERLDEVGVWRSDDDASALVAKGAVTRYEFVNRTTQEPVEVTVTQPFDRSGKSVGPLVAITPVPIIPFIPFHLDPLSELLMYLVLECYLVEIVVFFVVVVVVCVLVAVLVLVTLLVLLLYSSFASTARFLTTGTAPPYCLSVSDGTVVRDDGTVQFYLDATIPALPRTGGGWVQATRKAAITTQGDLWMLTPTKTGTAWTKYASPTGHRYIAISETGKWVAAVTVDDQGKTYLEIPPGKDQPAADSQIGKDVATLNAGKDPLYKDTVIDPPVPAWKSFVAGSGFGLALTTDGRVFGVGSNKNHQCDLPGRYSKVTTHGPRGWLTLGWLKKSRYTLAIRADDGSIEFAGKDPNHIAKDIAAANLSHVKDIAAGHDRAIAITQHGGIKVFGKQSQWSTPPPQSFEGNFTAVSASSLSSGKSVFVAGQVPSP